MKTTLWQRMQGEDGRVLRRPGLFRTVHPAITLRRVLPLAAELGITRLADVTGLDRLGLPVYQCIRPGSRNISVSSGKGLTRVQAKVSALMEALEAHHAEDIRAERKTATVMSLRPGLGYNPFDLPCLQSPWRAVPRDEGHDLFWPATGQPTSLQSYTPIEWVGATELGSARRTWIPRQLCELDFSVGGELCVPLFQATSNGLASGNTFTEAALHGLCEVVERDAAWRAGPSWQLPDRCIDPKTVTGRTARALIARIRARDLVLQIVDVTGPVGVACFEVYLGDPKIRANKGMGCHPDRETALLRALTECAQARIAHISGSRDDLYRETYESTDGVSWDDRVFAISRRGDYRQVPDLTTCDLGQLLRELVDRVRAATGTAPIAVDLTRPGLGIPVVFVVAPGLKFRPPGRRGIWVELPKSVAASADTQRGRAGGGGRPRVVIFAGPSVSSVDYRGACRAIDADVTIAPPVQQGDLWRLTTDPPDVVGIVDGFFGSVPAVQHKEILALMACGVRVLGASSMGALRAAELEEFGMEGVGAVFRSYRDGTLDADDEVALLHAPEVLGFRNLTQPLINLRHNVERARRAGIITARIAARTIAEARRLPYTERTFGMLRRRLRRLHGRSKEVGDLLRFLATHSEDLKRADALKLVDVIRRRINGGEPWTPTSVVAAPQTKYSYWQRREYVGWAAAGQQVPDWLVLALHKLLADDWPTTFRRVVRRVIAADQARHLGLGTTPAKTLLRKYRAAHRLERRGELTRWLARCRLSREELVIALQQADQAGRARQRYGTSRSAWRRIEQDVARRLGIDRRDLGGHLFVHPGIPWEQPPLVEIKMTGEFGDAADVAYRLLESYARVAKRAPDVVRSVDVPAVDHWASERWGVPVPRLTRAKLRRGFVNETEFQAAGRIAYVHACRCLLDLGIGTPPLQVP